MAELPEYVDGVPFVSGAEEELARAQQARAGQPIFLDESGIDFGRIRSACAIALHMHQPLIPAGGGDLRSAPIISNLKYMMDHQEVGDNHNASVFVWCYKRMGEFIPQLLGEGRQPRVMLEYSGTLLHGLRQMGEHDVLDKLKTITTEPAFRRCVEWLGMPWGHAVAPSTPVQDYRLHVKAWQNHFAAIFGLEALSRVRGFSPSEMALPNHPDVAYEFVKTLRDCGYQWVLVQEHTIEQPETGRGPEQKHLPHLLQCTNSRGETASIIAVIKTQGSDTKLVAQMQPYYEAKSLGRWDLAGRSVPPLVTQIADGENGGVMMNEFPPKFMEVVREASGSEVPLMTVSEYLEHLFALGQSLELYNFYTRQVANCDAQIQRQYAAMKPRWHTSPDTPVRPISTSRHKRHTKNSPPLEVEDEIIRITGVSIAAVDGIGAGLAQTILSEIGTDMSRWPSAKHFASWLGLAPHNDISGGRVLRSRTLPTNNRAGQAFRQAAAGVSRGSSAFGAYYRRKRAQGGPQFAQVATAHKIARTVYHLLKYHVPYVELGADGFEQKQRERGSGKTATGQPAAYSAGVRTSRTKASLISNCGARAGVRPLRWFCATKAA